MSRLGALLRRLADRVDPPAPPAPPVSAGEVKLISRDELREVQKQALQMVDDYVYLSRCQNPDDGLLWFPTDVLDAVAYLVGHELETRGRDFAAIERDPRMVLR